MNKAFFFLHRNDHFIINKKRVKLKFMVVLYVASEKYGMIA